MVRRAIEPAERVGALRHGFRVVAPACSYMGLRLVASRHEEGRSGSTTRTAPVCGVNHLCAGALQVLQHVADAVVRAGHVDVHPVPVHQEPVPVRVRAVQEAQ